MDTFLRKRVMEGVARRYSLKFKQKLLERAQKQVEKELKLIARAKVFWLLLNCVGCC